VSVTWMTIWAAMFGAQSVLAGQAAAKSEWAWCGWFVFASLLCVARWVRASGVLA
jgi:hypothetical protein